MTQDFLADCLWIFILQNVYSCYTIVAFILVDIALFLIGFAACSLICLAITLCTDLTKCVGLSLIMHQYENNWLLSDITLYNMRKCMSMYSVATLGFRRKKFSVSLAKKFREVDLPSEHHYGEPDGIHHKEVWDEPCL